MSPGQYTTFCQAQFIRNVLFYSILLLLILSAFPPVVVTADSPSLHLPSFQPPACPPSPHPTTSSSLVPTIPHVLLHHIQIPPLWCYLFLYHGNCSIICPRESNAIKYNTVPYWKLLLRLNPRNSRVHRCSCVS